MFRCPLKLTRRSIIRQRWQQSEHFSQSRRRRAGIDRPGVARIIRAEGRQLAAARLNIPLSRPLIDMPTTKDRQCLTIWNFARAGWVTALPSLGKVPVLMTPDVGPLFDSDVICAYLDRLPEARSLIPAEGPARWRALRMQAVAQGLSDAGIAVRWETLRRPEHLRYPALRDGHVIKLVAAYDWLEREIEPSDEVDVGNIAVATALDWLEFRGLCDFRTARPNLVAWFDRFAERPSMRATPLSGDTVD